MEQRNNLFPIFLKLRSIDILLVGGGNVGLEKLEALIKNDPQVRVTIVSETIRTEIRVLANQSEHIHLIQRAFDMSDLDARDLVILATDQPDLHYKIRQETRKRNTLTNVADTPDLCDFYLGSTVTKGNLKIGISTNGQSPTFAKRFREVLEDILPEETNELLGNLKAIRDRLKGDFSDKVIKLNKLTASLKATN